MSDSADISHMRRALELAVRGQGFVEPNPMVGCVIARNGEMVGEGWHGRFGGPHAEADALAAAGEAARGAAAYVTLEPCAHVGKTPPCTEALIAAGVSRVVAAMEDPFDQVAGRGLARLKEAGIVVESGLLDEEARRLNAPYLKLLTTGRPWVIAKWAMTLDGKIATRTGDSRWISSARSREIVHRLRGRMDAVLIGRGTAERDDPLLTARPSGPRTARRVVLDRRATLSIESRLVQTAAETPVLIAASSAAPDENVSRLEKMGCEVLRVAGESVLPASDGHQPRDARELDDLLRELGRRRMTNVLIEGGGRVLGAAFDGGAIDEVHVFIAPRLTGGKDAPSPLAGTGLSQIAESPSILEPRIELIHADETGTKPASPPLGDVYISGRLRVARV